MQVKFLCKGNLHWPSNEQSMVILASDNLVARGTVQRADGVSSHFAQTQQTKNMRVCVEPEALGLFKRGAANFGIIAEGGLWGILNG